MRGPFFNSRWFPWALTLLAGSVFPALAAPPPIHLAVDATEAPRNLFHAVERIPAQPGPLTLVYPEWIPGEHGPTGPIDDLTGLVFRAGGRVLEWRRDATNMYAFNLTVPDGAGEVEASFDFLAPPGSGSFSSGPCTTPNLMVLNWNQVVLSPQGLKAAEVKVAPSLRLPKGWKPGTALQVAHGKSGADLSFAPVSLETLVDSPVIAGAHFKAINLTPPGGVFHELDIVAESAADLDFGTNVATHYRRLVTEANALFGAHHYRSYHFLLTLSDHVAHFGLEHHESSDNRQGEKYLTDKDTLKSGGYLLPHEMVHSWNGKYRRPAGLATGDYEHPMDGGLLWVYEGLTDYLGIILAERSGLWDQDDFRQYLALEAGLLDHSTGRTWRPLGDTATAAQLLYEARHDGASWRRGTDFYSEGDLIWLEVDTRLRQMTSGKKSIADFCRAFHGGADSGPQVIPYTREDVITTLNQVAPFDWAGFFHERIDLTNSHAPFGGIERGGWKLSYTNERPAYLKLRENLGKGTDLRVSAGFNAGEDGTVVDVLRGSPAWQAGLTPGMKLVAVNSREWSSGLLRAALRATAKKPATIQLLIKDADYYKTLKLKYDGGEKYPLLEPVPGATNYLDDILKPLTPIPAAGAAKSGQG